MRKRSELAGRGQVGAAAQLAGSTPRPGRRGPIGQVLLAEEHVGARAASVRQRHPGRRRLSVAADLSFTMASTGQRLTGRRPPAGKSKRRPSGPTQLPACLACSPRTSRSARWSRWVAVWFRAAAQRRRASTRASTAPRPRAHPPAPEMDDGVAVPLGVRPPAACPSTRSHPGRRSGRRPRRRTGSGPGRPPSGRLAGRGQDLSPRLGLVRVPDELAVRTPSRGRPVTSRCLRRATVRAGRSWPASKPSRSTDTSVSAAISTVRSMGNPKVSCSRKRRRPDPAAPPAASTSWAVARTPPAGCG